MWAVLFPTSGNLGGEFTTFPTEKVVATSTVLTKSAVTVSTSTGKKIASQTSKPATSLPAKAVGEKPTSNPSLVPPVVAPVVVPQPARTESTTIPFSFDELNVETRAALVNILCTTKRGGSFNPLSGSGIIIDPRGIVLTNAHVGQYFLLKDFMTPDFLECLVRTGSPARNRYTAKLLYISPTWIEENAKKLNEEEPSGSGENDFALLLITGSTDPSVSLPSTYPYLPIDITDTSIHKDSDVLAAAYRAGF